MYLFSCNSSSSLAHPPPSFCYRLPPLQLLLFSLFFRPFFSSSYVSFTPVHCVTWPNCVCLGWASQHCTCTSHIWTRSFGWGCCFFLFRLLHKIYFYDLCFLFFFLPLTPPPPQAFFGFDELDGHWNGFQITFALLLFYPAFYIYIFFPSPHYFAALA